MVAPREPLLRRTLSTASTSSQPFTEESPLAAAPTRLCTNWPRRQRSKFDAVEGDPSLVLAGVALLGAGPLGQGVAGAVASVLAGQVSPWVGCPGSPKT